MREKLRAAVEASASLTQQAASSASASAQASHTVQSSPAPISTNARSAHFALSEPPLLHHQHGVEPIPHGDHSLSELNTNYNNGTNNHEFKPKALFRHGSEQAIFTQEEVNLQGTIFFVVFVFHASVKRCF